MRAVVARLESVWDEDLHLSAVTIGEIQAGVEIARDQDQDRAAEIEAWLEQVAETCNILSMEARTFRSWARLRRRRSDHSIEDAMIAATAAVHGLTVVTRDTRDFERLGALTFNPFDARAAGRSAVKDAQSPWRRIVPARNGRVACAAPRRSRRGASASLPDEPEPGHDEVMIECVGEPDRRSLHDREARRIDRGELMQVRAPKVGPRLFEIT